MPFYIQLPRVRVSGHWTLPAMKACVLLSFAQLGGRFVPFHAYCQAVGWTICVERHSLISICLFSIFVVVVSQISVTYWLSLQQVQTPYDHHRL